MAACSWTPALGKLGQYCKSENSLATQREVVMEVMEKRTLQTRNYKDKGPGRRKREMVNGEQIRAKESRPRHPLPGHG